jgi:hypothetical protein
MVGKNAGADAVLKGFAQDGVPVDKIRPTAT